MRRQLQSLNDVSLADQAKERIRTAILEGVINPGERITIEQIAAELGISRTPVREALKALEVDGIVSLLPRRGAVVESMALEEMVHRYEIRSMIEGYAAWLACRHDAEGVGRKLMEKCDALESAMARVDIEDIAQVRELGELNQQFHRIVRDACQSDIVIRMLESFRNPLTFTIYYWSNKARQETSLAIHREISRAFLAKKPVLARKLMARHLLEARDQFMHMERKRPPEPEPTADRRFRPVLSDDPT